MYQYLSSRIFRGHGIFLQSIELASATSRIMSSEIYTYLLAFAGSLSRL
jgi:hypothetical protein